MLLDLVNRPCVPRDHNSLLAVELIEVGSDLKVCKRSRKSSRGCLLFLDSDVHSGENLVDRHFFYHALRHDIIEICAEKLPPPVVD